VSRNSETGFGIHPVSQSLGTEAPFTGIKQPEHEANHSISNTKI